MRDDTQIGRGSYSAWSLDCFERRIAPLLREEEREILPGVDSTPWLVTCGPGEQAEVRHRLFPGSLLILWVEALAGPGATDGIEPVSAALECLHNASLVHDDILDSHEMRRRQPTLLATHGRAHALLGGDGLMASALAQLGKSNDARIPGCLTRLARATENMIAGQLLDEPEVWSRIDAAGREAHWLHVCRGKLALGNVAGPLAAFWTGRGDTERALWELLRDYSVISQIINDFGDVHGWAGYHTLAVSLRKRGHETALKPTLPAIWASQESDDPTPAASGLLERAAREIENRRRRALATLASMELEPEGRMLLEDFVERPRLPDTREPDP